MDFYHKKTKTPKSSVFKKAQINLVENQKAI